MRIRKATIKDLKSIQQLNHQLFENEIECFDDTLDEKWSLSKRGEKYFTKKLTDKKSIVFLAIENDEIVGYLAGEMFKAPDFRKPKKMSEIENMLVKEDHRGQGIGTRLAEQFLKWSKEQGAERSKVIASSKNKKGINFYKKNKFNKYETVLECDLN